MPSPLATLVEMLSYKRPRQTATHERFCLDYLADLPGAFTDTFDNWHVPVGEPSELAPRVLWSCHTDTVHNSHGMQQVRFQNGVIDLPKKSKSGCLGADDTVGVFLMREMILAGVPGHYLFHEGEERGCVGSTLLAENFPEWLGKFSAAIAFDRKGTDEIITHQCGQRGASQAFAWSLAAQLGNQYKPSDNGIYTDTYQYHSLIAECTNIGVGYYNQHSAREWIDAKHVLTLLAALLTIDTTALVIERNPADYESIYDDWGYGSWGSGWTTGRSANASWADRDGWTKGEDGVYRLTNSLKRNQKYIAGGTHEISDIGVHYCSECCQTYTSQSPCLCDEDHEIPYEDAVGDARCLSCDTLILDGQCFCGHPVTEDTSIFLPGTDQDAVQAQLRADFIARNGQRIRIKV